MDLYDPTHWESNDPAISWTIANVGEALGGVQPPLAVMCVIDASEVAGRQAWFDLGGLRRDELPVPDGDRRQSVAIYGRWALNLKTSVEILKRLPGDPERFEQNLTGESTEEASAAAVRARKPSLAKRLQDIRSYWRFAWVGATATRRLRTRLQSTEQWWRVSVHEDHDRPGAQRLLRDARDRYVDVLRHGLHHSLLGQMTFARVGQLAGAHGLEGIEAELFTGIGMPEDSVARDLWAASRGGLTVAEIVERHGYQSPHQFDVLADSWRTKPATIEPLVSTLSGLGEDQSPDSKRAAQAAIQRRAEQRLLSALSGTEKLAARALIAMTKHFMRQREAQKVGCLMTLDVARSAIRQLADDLTRDGVIGEPGDIAFFTLDEACAPTQGGDVAQVLAFRRAKYEQYKLLDLPEAWTGPAVPVPAGKAAEQGDDVAVSGVPVTPGVVEGRACVVDDPEDAYHVAEGDVLVCRSTDPSWTPIMLVASALVIDVGGPMSHGAIVARELGVPCVINTKSGTRQIRTGDTVRVDGSTGRVEVLKRAETAS